MASGLENSFGMDIPSSTTRTAMAAGPKNRASRREANTLPFGYLSARRWLSHTAFTSQHFFERPYVRRARTLAPDQDGVRTILCWLELMKAQTPSLWKCRQHTLWYQGYTHTSNDAAEYGVIR
jgi:hypothetical protein